MAATSLFHGAMATSSSWRCLPPTMKSSANGGTRICLLSYADFASISEYAIPSMQWTCGSGIVTGVTDTTLAPQGTATRAQCDAMLMRFVEL